MHTAEAFDRSFRAVYAAFHRRDGVARGLSNTSRAILEHLSLAGPLSVGEAAVHLQRSQSATSELLAQLERNGLVERRRDPLDARRADVWLSDEGRAVLRREESVLSLDLLAAAFEHMSQADRDRLSEALTDLLRASAGAREPEKSKGTRP